MFFGGPSMLFVLVDWQWAAHSNPGMDIAAFLSQSLAPDVRREHETELFDLFAHGLRDGGVDDYSSDHLLSDYLLGILYHFGAAVIPSTTLDEGNEGARRLFDVLVRRSVAAILDHRSKELL